MFDHYYATLLFLASPVIGIFLIFGLCRFIRRRPSAEEAKKNAAEYRKCLTSIHADAEEWGKKYAELTKELQQFQCLAELTQNELDAVMVSVDKWFPPYDPRLSNNPATRAADAREIALQAIERGEGEGAADIEWIAHAVHTLAIAQGWYDEPQTEDAYLERACNNLHDEVSELHDAWRNNLLRSPCDKAEKMKQAGIVPLTCLEEELADIAIRVFDTSVRLNVDIADAIKRKHAFNATRPRRHGGKRS